MSATIRDVKASNSLWKDRLGDSIPPHLSREIDVFENEILLRKRGKLEEPVFAESRLRRGVYGQRYDNGQRHDGKETRKLNYPDAGLTKGPQTLWHAPGMQRIKIPYGGLTSTQLETLAELAEEYSDDIAHVTTRQDFQLHFIHIEDTPSIMRRLAAAGITTREACGNTVRNVTACPLAGVCRTQVFDVTPYARALAYFLLGHPDAQAFGRKFKISFSGCEGESCGLARMHDFGAIGVIREADGIPRRGFKLYVGGGLGAVPQQARLFAEFLPEEELLPTAQAIGRVFARLGEKKNRSAARLKFLVSKQGIDEFRRLVMEERAILPFDPRWTEFLKDIEREAEPALKPPSLLQIDAPAPEGFVGWKAANVYAQRQPGYSVVTLALPLGDITPDQLRSVADIARKYVKDTIRTTVEQNLVLRWVSNSELRSIYTDLLAAGLASPVAGTIADIVTCPGTDTCKLGIASARGLAGKLRTRFAEQASLAPEVRGLRIKISGCFNSCGQHHVADLGFYGVSRNKHGYTVAHFQVVLGGQWSGNAASYGLAIGAIPSKRIPETVDRITSRFVHERESGESFQGFIRRIGKAECKKMLEDLAEVPPHDADPSYYSDWSDPREFTIGDMGTGECAGMVVAPVEFQLAACEREVFEAQLQLEKGDAEAAAAQAYQSMLHGAAALLRHRQVPFDDTPDSIVGEFSTHLVEPHIFWDRFVGGNLANYFFKAHEATDAERTARARELLEESQLFIEACHACYLTMSGATVR